MLKLWLKLTASDNWVTVPTNSVVTIHKQTVLIHPILDEFYSHEPSHQRSAALATEQGQMSTRPAAAGLQSGVVTPIPSMPQGETMTDDINSKLRALTTAGG